MNKEAIKNLEGLKIWALARCEKYADLAQISPLTPAGDEHAIEAIKDKKALTYALNLCKRVDEEKILSILQNDNKPYSLGHFSDKLTKRELAQAIVSYFNAGEGEEK